MYHSKVHVLMYLSGIADCVEYIFLLSCQELVHVHAYTVGVSWKHHKKLGMFKTSLGLRNSCCSTLVVGNLKWNKNLNKYERIWIKDIKGTTERKDVIVKTNLALVYMLNWKKKPRHRYICKCLWSYLIAALFSKTMVKKNKPENGDNDKCVYCEKTGLIQSIIINTLHESYPTVPQLFKWRS